MKIAGSSLLGELVQVEVAWWGWEEGRGLLVIGGTGACR